MRTGRPGIGNHRAAWAGAVAILAVVSVLAAAGAVNAAGSGSANLGTPDARHHTHSPSPSPTHSPSSRGPSPSATATGGYYTGDYKISLNLYSFNVNLNAFVKGRTTAPPLDPMKALDWAHQAGFDAVFIPFYYVPGYSNTGMPTLPTAQISAYVQQLKARAAADGLAITGTGIFNDFASPDPSAVALDVQRMEFWLNEAQLLGAPLMRVFSGFVPADLSTAGGWSAVAQNRIVPALKTVTAYAANLGITMGLQNHGDMTATAAQTIQIMNWVGSPDLKLIDDSGYFQDFQAANGDGYPWYQDIDACLPYSADIDVKLKPADENTTTLMNFNELLSGVRESPYHGYIDLERLWAKTDADNPKNQPTPPYTEVAQFLAQVRAALAATKNGPAS